MKRFIDEVPTVDEALELFNTSGNNLMELLSIGNEVRSKYCTNEMQITTLTNAKSGKCTEDCSFCAQSAHHKTKIENYTLKDVDKIVEEFDHAINENKTDIFCIVTATKALVKEREDYAKIVEIVMELKKRNQDVKLCASIGLMDDAVAEGLKAAGVDVYNHNLQTAPSKYASIVSTTHKIEDRLNALKAAKKAGLEICTGGIIGLGETTEDLVEMAFKLKELDADVIPLNALIPIKGTKMENQKDVDIMHLLKTVAIFRIINKKASIKIGAGRETVMKDFMGMAFLSGANCLISGGYLTEGGRQVSDDHKFKNDIEKIWNS